MSSETSTARARALGAVVVALIGLTLFASSWSDAVQLGDGAELAAAACRGGVAHPPGYPLYLLLGRGLCHLPWSTPAGRVALVSLLAAVWALLALYGCVIRLTANVWAAAAAALTLATGSVFWRAASQADVFTLNAALCLTVVYCGLRAAPPDPAPVGAKLAPEASAVRPGLLWSLLAGLAAGLALSNHHSSLVVLPAVALVAVWPPRPLGRAIGRSGAALAGLVLGLLPYLYLLRVDRGALPRWGDPSSWSGLIDHVLRRDLGTFSLTVGSESAPVENLGGYLLRVPTQLGLVLWLAALLGAVALLRTGPVRGLVAPARRDLALLVAVLPLLAGPAFLLLFQLPGPAAERHDILPTALWAIDLGVGIAVLEELVSSPRRLVVLRAALFCVVGVSALLSQGRADVSRRYLLEDYARNALSAGERGALVLDAGGDRLFAVSYVQQLLGVRPDVQYLDLDLVRHPWYRVQKERERPGLLLREGELDPLRLILGEIRRGVPIYLAPGADRKIVSVYATYPVGPLLRLLPPGHEPPPPRDLLALNERLFRGLLQRGTPPSPTTDPEGAALLEPYARTWRHIAGSMLRTGDRRAAVRALARAHEWAPWMPLPDGFGPTPRGPRPRRVR